MEFTTTTGLTVEEIVQRIIAERRIPRATYRFQFNANFAFEDAQALVDYLDELGISECYTSPLFKPREGSTHGYDIVDYSDLNPVLGGRAKFDALTDTLRTHNMGLLIDIVPNHMGIGSGNHWWMDVLANGPASPYARFFDISWNLLKRGSRNKIILPILGDHYGRVLENGELQLTYADDRFYVRYWETRLPIAVKSSRDVLALCYTELVAQVGNEDDAAQELQSILTALRYLAPYTETDAERLRERRHEQEILRRRFAMLYASSAAVRAALETALTTFNGVSGDSESYNYLDKLMNKQPYRLAFWRVASDEINYRRFFDINDMAALRIEFPEVFRASHQLLFDLMREGKVSGVRIDHPDGLWNPPLYFLELQEGYVAGKAELYAPNEEVLNAVLGTFSTRFQRHEDMADSWPLYVVVEKILSELEPLPRDWAVYGTTGYDFLNVVNGIFVNSDNVFKFDSLYRDFIGRAINFKELVYDSKKMIMEHSLASEMHARAQQLDDIAERNRRYRGFTQNGLMFALTEITACMSIYRTYITGPGMVSERDRRYVEEAVAEAKRRNPRVPVSVFDFVRDVLLLDNITEFSEEERGSLIEFVMKFQQVTGPVMAKGVEDTTFYIYNRLVSLNEVGGHPEQFGVSVEDFHNHNEWREAHWRYTMLDTSTHDTKRSEDVRARISVLSEIPDEWGGSVAWWRQINEDAKTVVDGVAAPDRNDEYLLYQVILGAWEEDQEANPDKMEAFKQRIVTYMQKAIKEAKVHTSWVNPNEAYDAATRDFVTGVLENPHFVHASAELRRKVAFYGRFNALSQTLLKLTTPGIPDIYQGNEMWDYSLVDPDNRRPVDYAKRRAALADLKARTNRAELAEELVNHAPDGRIKLYTVWRALDFRRENPALFDGTTYTPLWGEGNRARHVCAFMRETRDAAFIVAVPRLVFGLTGGSEYPPLGGAWENTQLRLPDGEAGNQYRDVFTDTVLTVSEDNTLDLNAIFGRYPVALLARVTD